MATMAQVTLRTSDNVAANFITNQFCTTDDVATGADADALVQALADFYESLRTTVLAQPLQQTGHIVKLYEMPGLTPNYPYVEDTFDFASSFGNPGFPSEVAICLSFQAPRQAGLVQARRRGRIYLGPIATTTATSARPNSTIRQTIVTAAETLYADIDAITSAGIWGVWSTRDAQAVGLDNCWVDDAYDTQRSRGVQVTARTTGQF